jgi:hypothetical protein
MLLPQYRQHSTQHPAAPPQRVAWLTPQCLHTHRLLEDLKHEVGAVAVHKQHHRLGVCRGPEVGLQVQAILVLHHAVHPMGPQVLRRLRLQQAGRHEEGQAERGEGSRACEVLPTGGGRAAAAAQCAPSDAASAPALPAEDCDFLSTATAVKQHRLSRNLGLTSS